jgi:2-polyprenyl-3-methyl-5-hydroxy-6-metoxy-1,4-benzoquinol methylase
MSRRAPEPAPFVYPHTRAFQPAGGRYRGPYRSYSHYNYLRPGPIAALKRRHFAVALELARPWFHGTGALDFGCADGILLPSLARYFPRAIGVDRDPAACAIANAVVADLGLDNVRVVCTAGTGTSDALRTAIGATPRTPYGIAFALETLEHIGAPNRRDADALRASTVRDLLALLAPPARIIVSVPRMTGLAFLAKYGAQRLLGVADEPVSLREALDAGVRRDTTALAPRWRGGHVGFDEGTFERAVRGVARIHQRRTTWLSALYVLESRDSA